MNALLFLGGMGCGAFLLLVAMLILGARTTTEERWTDDDDDERDYRAVQPGPPPAPRLVKKSV